MQEKDGIEYFWDSYAIIELEKGNPKYERFKDSTITLTIFNLPEIYWSFLKLFNEKIADEIYKGYSNAIVDVDDETLKEAIKFRKKVYKKKKISYADAIGYIYALRNKMVFLTGDKEFEGLENVEFVKK